MGFTRNNVEGDAARWALWKMSAGTAHKEVRSPLTAGVLGHIGPDSVANPLDNRHY